MAHIDYYLGTASPWCYLAGGRLEQIAHKHRATITYKPVDLMQLFDRTGGVRPMDRPAARQEYRAQELTRWAVYLNMAFNLSPMFWPVNPAPSSYAVIAAQEEGGAVGGLAHNFLRAVWAEQRDIADDGVIRDVLTASGFDPALADRGLLTGAEQYTRNLDDAVAAGVFGAPFYVVRETGQRFWGQDRLQFLDDHLAAL
ncbi:MAG: 2-hydroxychromene-2-carboxylate isomerase [Paracoccus sp. (in: a-proteobacteria)]|nr:2-hydroxychromene-2-carboxylate isomerase [Paracoccus sp. (in: a-proteobacteria)]